MRPLKIGPRSLEFDIHMSVHHKITANKMQLFLNLFIFTDALYVSGGSSAYP